MDGVGADEVGLRFRILVFQYEVDDFNEIGVKFVERVGLGMGSGEIRDVAYVVSGVGTTLDDGGVAGHCGSSFDRERAG